jgi:hypothetical protein
MVADVCDAEAPVATVNVALVAPEGTVTELGTVAEGELLLRLTAMPPDGAAEESVTVPVALDPPTTELGEMLIADKVWPCASIGKKIAKMVKSNALGKRKEKTRSRVGIIQAGHDRLFLQEVGRPLCLSLNKPGLSLSLALD